MIVLSVQRKFLTMAKKSVKLYTDNVLDAFYDAIRTNSLDRLHIPHSDVFYVRTALDTKFFPRTFTLKETEDYMRLEGWKEKDE